MEILITAGGTEEQIDGVRTISNFSTGKTGAVIADTFFRAGFNVTLLTSNRGITPKEDANIIRYGSFNDLDKKLQRLLKNIDFTAVIHAAAVSDYSVDYLESSGIKFQPSEDIKLDSSKPLSIMLKPNFKIISRLKSYSKNNPIVIGFKLTKNASKELIKQKVNNIFDAGMVDFVVHNDLTSIDKNTHISTIYRDNIYYKGNKTKEDLAKSLVEIFKAGRDKIPARLCNLPGRN